MSRRCSGGEASRLLLQHTVHTHTRVPCTLMTADIQVNQPLSCHLRSPLCPTSCSRPSEQTDQPCCLDLACCAFSGKSTLLTCNNAPWAGSIAYIDGQLVCRCNAQPSILSLVAPGRLDRRHQPPGRHRGTPVVSSQQVHPPPTLSSRPARAAHGLCRPFQKRW